MDQIERLEHNPSEADGFDLDRLVRDRYVDSVDIFEGIMDLTKTFIVAQGASATGETVAAFIGSTLSAFAGVASLGPKEEPAPAAAKLSAAEIRKSVTDDGLTSFIDGKVYRTLKRHLSKHGMTGEDYRARFGLPADYPLVARSYSAKRSELAKSLGLGSAAKRGGTKAADGAETGEAKPAKSKAPKAAKAKGGDLLPKGGLKDYKAKQGTDPDPRQADIEDPVNEPTRDTSDAQAPAGAEA